MSLAAGMRFVFLTQGYHPDIDGGAYRYAAEVAEVLASRGHEVHALAKNPENKLPDSEFRNGVHLHRLRSPGGGFLKNWSGVVAAADAELEKLLTLPGRTLILSHHAYFEKALKNIRHAAFFHGPWGLEHRFACAAKPRNLLLRLRDAAVASLLHRTEGRALKRVSRVFVASGYMRDRVRQWHPHTTAPVEVVGGGANHARFNDRIDREAARKKFQAKPGERVFLSVRRLDPRMGLRVLVEAFGKISSRYSESSLWVVGRGAQKEELERMVSGTAIADRVRFPGFVPESDLPDLYAAADCVVMPSLDLEGFGLVTAEAMACGTPVIASNAGANAEVIGGLDGRLIFESGSVESLAGKLSEILSGHLQLPARHDCAGYARREFRWDRAADGFEHAFDAFAVEGGRT